MIAPHASEDLTAEPVNEPVVGVWTVPARGHQRSLRSKLVLSLAAMCAFFLLIDEALRRNVIQPAFEDLEYASAMRDTNRVMSAIKVESEHLRDIAEQAASQIDTARSDAKSDREIFDSFGQEVSVRFDGVQWAAIVGDDKSWDWVYQSPSNLAALNQLEANETQPGRDDLLCDTIVSRIGASNTAGGDGIACDQERRIHAFATAPVFIAPVPDSTLVSHSPTSYAISDGVQHYLVVGKTLDNPLVAELRRRTQVAFSIQVFHQRKIDQTIRTWAADDSTLVVEVPIVQNDHETLANLFVQVPRDFVKQAKQTTSLARNVFVGGVAASLILMLLQLQRIVVGPLERIREHTEQIAKDGLTAGTLSMTSNDEIGALATAFDHMSTRLADTHKRLADASHAAGMSQVADTVIHNVGNVLTNVNSLIETATDRVDGLRVAPLNKLAGRLRQGGNRDEVLAATPDYLQRLSAELEKDQCELSGLLSTLHDNVQHIHSVIRDQRQYTQQSIDQKQVSMVEIINEAVACCQANLLQDEIVVRFSFTRDCVIQSDRSLLLQIIINLIGNARNAMIESDCESRLLQLSLTDQNDMARFAVSDCGCGMTTETLARVFDAHFTTRAAGTGLGLHFSAITIKRLGGKIVAQSDGLGQGSTFTIELPIATHDPPNDPATPKTATVITNFQNESIHVPAIGASVQ